MKLLLQFALLAAALLACQPGASAQARTYDALKADVPFKFNIGNRTFKPGQYHFVIVGAGLMAVRDARLRVVASLITRLVDADTPSAPGRLVFETEKKRHRLARILMEDHAQSLEILGEQVGLRSAPQPSVWSMPPDSSFFERRNPGFTY
jgi:hypothetical protein